MATETINDGKVFALESPTDAPRVIHLIGGPLPYLWIGEEPGSYYGSTVDTAQLRALRDAITQALRHAAGG